MRYILFFLFIFPSFFLVASESNYSFSNFSPSDGLVHKTINCMMQDRDGFLWIGTSNGVSRFDGYSFRNFKHNSKNPRSLNGISVFGIVEGKDGRLWLSTDVGIEYFDKHTEEFRLSSIPEIKNNKFDKNIHFDENGLLWINNSNTNFIAFDPQTQKIKHHITKIPGITINSVYQFIIQNGTLWIACMEGIVAFDLKKQKLTFIEKQNFNYCSTIHKVNDSIIVMTFMHAGVYVLNTIKQSGYWVKTSTIEKNIGIKTIPYDAYLGADNSLWIGLASGIVNIKNNTYNYYNNYSLDKYFDGDLVYNLLRDIENNIFLGTIENGIYLKRQNTEYFKLATRLFKNEVKKTEISNFDVFDNGSLLYSNFNGLFICKDYKNLKDGCAQKINSMVSVGIYPLDGNSCLVNTADSIYVFDSHTNKLTWVENSTATSIGCRDKNGIIWLGSWIGVLNGYDPKSHKSYNLYVDVNNKKNIPVLSLYADSDGSLWVGTVSAGLIHIKNPTDKHPIYEQYNVKPNGQNSIASSIILCIYPDKYNNLWIGTNGGGISKLNKQTKIFENLTEQNGLKSNNIESLDIDNDGNIWIASNVLTKYDIRKKTFTHYSEFDGIDASFIWKGAKCSKDGLLLFANKKGIIVFDPNKLPIRKGVAKPILTGLRIRGISMMVGDSLNGEVPYTRNITYSKELILPYSYNSFAIEFASIGFQESRNILYEYMLNGIDQTWISADTRSRLASYSGLQPGKYIFKVRASNGAGGWSEPRILYVEIIPPWWLTWWFKIGIILFMVIIVFAVILSRFKLIKKQNKELEAKVLERTEELTAASEHLHLQNDQLKENQIVIEMKNLELIENVQAKDELMKVVSHDFKSPLTGILEMAEILVTDNLNTKTDKSKKIAESILSSAKSLVDQMFTVLDWAQNHNEELVSNPIEINLEMLLDDAISLVKESALQKNISITKQIEVTTYAFIDPRMISIVFRNLLKNAITFTNQGGSILVLIQEHDNGIDSVFIDTGIGIVSEKLETIFNKTTSYSENIGTDEEIVVGVGLDLCKSFVEKNMGQIKASSQKENGSIFTVSLPKGENQVSNKTKIQSLELQKNTNQVDSNDPFTILIIDDTIEVLEIIENLFDENVTVVKAEEGNRGLYIAQNILPDIIICDIILPGKTGLEICKVLKSNDLTSFIPVLLISSKNGDEIAVKSFESGANDFIEKPFNPYTLKQKVLSLLEFRKHIREEILKSFESNQQTNMPIDYDNKIIKKVIDFINSNISDPDLNVEAIVDNIGISRAHLWRVFKKTTDKSLGDYIREIKMQKAAEMLKTGKYRVSEVAAEVGFFDAKNFSKNFSKEYGMTPSQYIESSKK